ncbi:hypothetical protein KEM52_004830 [Ascosphaera acerosa]|nr:hypothetical protein KEM52_004830 [Ascosphaera acerosa]
MVATYTLFGRQVGSHVVCRSISLLWSSPLAKNSPSPPFIQLSLATIGTLGGGIALASGGKKGKSAEPPIAASSKDEETFIKEFLQNVQAGDKAATTAAKA